MWCNKHKHMENSNRNCDMLCEEEFVTIRVMETLGVRSERTLDGTPDHRKAIIITIIIIYV